MIKKHYWVYILHCVNNSYYTGYTADLTKRYHAHRKGSASKYTRSFKPLSVVFVLPTEDKARAMKMERAIKKLSRAQKEKLIACSLKMLCSEIKFY